MCECEPHAYDARDTADLRTNQAYWRYRDASSDLHQARRSEVTMASDIRELYHAHRTADDIERVLKCLDELWDAQLKAAVLPHIVIDRREF